MKKIIYILLFLASIATFAQEQPNNGFLPSRVTTLVRNGFTQPAKGLIIFNTSTDQLEINLGTVMPNVPNWVSLIPGSNVISPTFRAKKSTFQNIMADSVLEKILFETEQIDTNNNYSNSRFTPTVAGNYSFNLSMVYASSFTNTLPTCAIFKNGIQHVLYTSQIPSTGRMQFNFSDIIYMNGSTDYIEIFASGRSTDFIWSGFGSFSGTLIK